MIKYDDKFIQVIVNDYNETLKRRLEEDYPVMVNIHDLNLEEIFLGLHDEESGG